MTSANQAELHQGKQKKKSPFWDALIIFAAKVHVVKQWIVWILLLVVSIPVNAQVTGKDCNGMFRWDVKTLTDPGGAAMISADITGSTLSELVSVHPPKHFFIFSKKDGHLPRYDDEKILVRIKAYIVSIKTERDQDVHITLQSPGSSQTMIAEIPDPGCRIFDTLPGIRKSFTEARHQLQPVVTQLEKTKKPVLVEITGVPFWDARHWWLRGCAKNGREIHPVLSVKILPAE